jgi:hypothetical protein
MWRISFHCEAEIDDGLENNLWRDALEDVEIR